MTDQPILSEFIFPEDSFSSRTSTFSISEEAFVLNEKKLLISEISSIKYGIKALEFYKFYTGLVFLIDLKDHTHQEINIRMNSILFFKKKLFNELFENIATVIWDKIAVKLIHDKISLLRNNQSFMVGNCEIMKDGILIDRKHLILWKDCYFQKNYDQLVINSTANQKVYTYLPYADHWDVFILLEVAEQIVAEEKQKGSFSLL